MIKKINANGETQYVEVSKEEYHKILCKSIEENTAIAKQVMDECGKYDDTKFPDAVIASLVQAAISHVAFKVDSILLNRLLKEQQERSERNGE